MSQSATQDPNSSTAQGTSASDEGRERQLPGGGAVERGVVQDRKPWMQRLNAWRKRSAFNPYWIDARLLREAVDRLAEKSSGVLLDVGVAERPYEAAFLPYVDKYIGLEYPVVVNNLNPDIWDHLYRIRGIIDIWGDGNQLPFGDECLDTVLTVEVLEHVPDPRAMIAEFYRVLKPGGRLLLSVPFGYVLHQLPYDFYRFTPEGIRIITESAGFEVEEIRPRGNMAHAMGALSASWLLRMIGGKKNRQHDGSIALSRWKLPIALPLIALVQLFWMGVGKLNKDRVLTVGHYAVVRKPLA